MIYTVHICEIFYFISTKSSLFLVRLPFIIMLGLIFGLLICCISSTDTIEKYIYSYIKAIY